MKVKFYVNDIESEIIEYYEEDYVSYEDMLENIEEDRNEFVYRNIDTGWIKIEENDNKERSNS
jgi:hypothetical protein